MIRILATLCVKSSKGNSGSGAVASNLTPVQKTILETFDTIDIDDDDIAMELFNQLFLILYDTTGNSFDSEQSNRIPNQSNFLLTENIIEVFFLPFSLNYLNILIHSIIYCLINSSKKK